MKVINKHDRNIISIWLALMCCSIIMMIFLGGFTRLTESGLSITEWNPISGIIPPISEVEWNIEFDKYKKSPEYVQRNSDMSLREFKYIYLVEFIHRIAGRVITILYVVPLLFFWIKGKILQNDFKIYIIGLFLILTQGIMGWYMVKSGLILNPYVSHYRLGMHLMLAIFLYIIMFWQLMKNFFDIILISPKVNLQRLYYWSLKSIILVLIQITLGAFVAGLKGGLVYNNFPLMGENFVPDEISTISIESFRDPVFVQFMHRIIAYILFIIICIFCMKSLRVNSKKLSFVIYGICLTLLLQTLLGITTLIYNVPMTLALLHQLGAVMLLSYLLWAHFLIIASRRAAP